jgi:acyloxyacyl hydrolase
MNQGVRVVFVSLISIVLILCLSPKPAQAKNDGAIPCLVCTIVLEIIEQILEEHPEPVEDFLKDFCNLIPKDLRPICDDFIEKYGKEIAKGIINRLSSDDICLGIKICSKPECRLRPKFDEKGEEIIPSARVEQVVDQQPIKKEPSSIFDTNELPDWIKKLIQTLEDHKPILDLDNDTFSTEPYLRGSNWRGKDCNDLDARIYPGRREDPFPGLNFDFNCNGIFGSRPKKSTDGVVDENVVIVGESEMAGDPWKQVLCEDSGQTGVILLGDSAGAHFSIPPEWLTPKTITKDTFNNLPEVLLNEADWPHRSGWTGWVNSSEKVLVKSIYKRMLERNKCNHRDFQNLGVNGARSGSALQNSKVMGRAPSDHPSLVFLELIGNDVCSGHHDFDHMTKPEEFKQNIYNILNWLDTALAPGSHLFIFGIGDGRILYDSLGERNHPIGVTYRRVYDLLNCLDTSPCWGWMNSNKTVRELTTQHAFKLNDVYRVIVNETKNGTSYKNFDFVYYDIPTEELINKYISEGGDPQDLIEAVDGFHPSQMFHALLADWMWEKMEKFHPTFIGKENPNNELITYLFGSQGGY